MGAAVGIPLSSFCIIRRLYGISRVQAVAVTYDEVYPTTEITRSETDQRSFQKRRAILIDSFFCVLLPMIEMALGRTCNFFRTFNPLLEYQHMLSRVTALTSSKRSDASPAYTTHF